MLIRESSLWNLWKHLTTPKSNNLEQARREFMTKVIILIMAFVSFCLSVIFFLGYSNKLLPIDSFFTTFILFIFFGFGFWITRYGYWQFASYIPPIIIFIAAVYGNFIGGAGAPAMLIYAVAILLTAILQGERFQWIMMGCSLLSYSLIYIAYIYGLIEISRNEQNMFVNRIVIATGTFICLSSLIWFLVNQYKESLTKSIQIGDELRNREKLYRLLAENSTDMISMFSLEGRYRYVSPSSEIITGYTAEELLGKSIYGNIIYEDLEVVKNALQEIITNKGYYQCSYRIFKKNMDWMWIETTFHAINDPDLNNTLEIQASTRNIDDRKKAEEALVQSERKYREFTKFLPQAVFEINLAGEITFANQKAYELFGYLESDLDNNKLSYTQMIFNDEKKSVTDVFQKIVNGETTTGNEYIGIKKDGSHIPILVYSSRVEENGKPVGVRGVIVDIAERKRVENEIQQLNLTLERRVAERTLQLKMINEELESFSYSVSHDLRAPLRTIEGFSNVLLEDFSDKLENEGRNILQRIQKSVQRMSDLIDDLLKLSRITSSELLRHETNISSLVNQVVNELMSQQAERKCEILVPDGIIDNVDARLVLILMENLIGNAWKFSSKQEKTQIEFGLTVDEQGDKVYFIKDNGVGFEMAYKEKLFRAFQRLHSVSDFPGTGIGLATVHRIVLKHGGKIWAESTIDQGATFYFSLNKHL